MLALDQFFETGSDQVVHQLYDALSQPVLEGLPAPPSLLERQILRSDYREGSVQQGKDPRFFESKIDVFNVPMPLRIPLYMYPGEIGDFSLIQLVNRFNAPMAQKAPLGVPENQVMVILNALVAQKRILFLGHGCRTEEIVNCVLATIAMGGPVLGAESIAARAFPYTNLSQVDSFVKM